jgi:5-methylcytosine-specific restriction endonuclease McrA
MSVKYITQAEIEQAFYIASYYLRKYRRLRLNQLKSMPYKEYLKTKEWQRKRKEKLEEANYKCQRCNIFGVELDVHHLTYERRGEELPEDLIVLCKKCHAKEHGKDNK